MVAIAPRIAKGHWRRIISRPAEMWSVAGLISLLLFIPLIWALPSLEDGRRSLWFYNPGDVYAYSPHLWTTLSIVALVVVGFLLLWLSALPDLASIRDRSPVGSQTRRRYEFLARGWIGTTAQWNWQKHRLGILGAFYFLMLITVHFFFSIDFLMTLVPGWIDALYPATHAANALQAGTATVILTMFFLRKFCGYKEIGLDQFHGLGKLMFALSLLWFWFWFSSFNVFWYGKKPNEQAVLDLFIRGPYMPIFYLTFITVFIFPFVTMIWNFLRRSTWGPTLIAISVLIGTFFDRVRLYVAGYSVGDQASHHHGIEHIPATVYPDLANVFIVVGALGGVVLLYLIASRVIPIINLWEQKELLLYKVHKKYHRTTVLVLGKPE
jgi:molybdopterin-containing oxidoreductase family membrane subunit